MKSAVLLPNIVGFPSESMRRYAMELESALRSVAGGSEGSEAPWGFRAIACAPSEAVAARFGGGERGKKIAGRHARFVLYPRLIRAASGADLYHVLDHSHTNLALIPPAAKTVLTCHDIIPLLAAKGMIPIPSNGRFTRYTFPLRVRCMKRCHRVIAISESTKKNLVEVAGLSPDQIRVVYYGVNRAFAPAPGKDSGSHAEERREVLARHQIPASARVLFHVGTATRYKNTPAILHALKALKEDPKIGGSVYFLRVGAEFFDDEKALIETLGVGDRIRHAGKIFDDSRLASYYRAGDVFVFPSIWEGFGWPPLEAMACGTPVVTSNIASLPEVVGDAGITVAPQDHAALIDALRLLLTNEEARQTRREKALLRARRFTWEECARGTLAVYEQVVAENAGRRPGI
ncbi:MAG: glycosyltransferase family 4 protein [Cytophagales bacterium]|nr:glycosyltransferase family 4 protein [Armatimonadota bacterium]